MSTTIQNFFKSKPQRDARKIQNISSVIRHETTNTNNTTKSKILNISAPYVNRRDKPGITNSPLNLSNQIKNPSTNQSSFMQQQQQHHNQQQQQQNQQLTSSIKNMKPGISLSKILNPKKNDFFRQYLANTIIQKKNKDTTDDSFITHDNNHDHQRQGAIGNGEQPHNHGQVHRYHYGLHGGKPGNEKENQLQVNTDLLSQKIEQLLHSNPSFNHLSRPSSVTNKALHDKGNFVNYFVSPSNVKTTKHSTKPIFIFTSKDMPNKESTNSNHDEYAKSLPKKSTMMTGHPEDNSNNVSSSVKLTSNNLQATNQQRIIHGLQEDVNMNSIEKLKQGLNITNQDNSFSKFLIAKKKITLDERSLIKDKDQSMVNSNSKIGLRDIKDAKQDSRERDTSSKDVKNTNKNYNQYTLTKQINLMTAINSPTGIITPIGVTGTPTTGASHHYGKPPLFQSQACMNNSGNLSTTIDQKIHANIEKLKNLNIQSVKENKKFEFPPYLANYTCEGSKKNKDEHVSFKLENCARDTFQEKLPKNHLRNDLNDKSKPNREDNNLNIVNSNVNDNSATNDIGKGIGNSNTKGGGTSNIGCENSNLKASNNIKVNNSKSNSGSFYQMITEYIAAKGGSHKSNRSNGDNSKNSNNTTMANTINHLDLRILDKTSNNTTNTNTNNNTYDDIQTYLNNQKDKYDHELKEKIRNSSNDKQKINQPNVFNMANKNDKYNQDIVNKPHYNTQVNNTPNISKVKLASDHKSPIKKDNEYQKEIEKVEEEEAIGQSSHASATSIEQEILILDYEQPAQRKIKEINFIRDYRIYQQLGQGAYAVVRLGVYIPTNMQVAIKIYEKQKIMDPMRRKSVKREIKLMEKMDHPNIVKIYDTIETSHHLNIIMEYVGGHSFYTLLKEQPNRRLKEEHAYQLFKQALNGIAYCHNKCITHRDIKLENLLINENGLVKIIDFGFSTFIPNDKRVKMFCGTPSYMAPEIVLKKEYCGPPADIWALGVLLYTLLCGTFPFKGATDKELYRKICKGEFHVPEHLSESAVNFLQKILNIDADRRPSARDLYNHIWMITNAALEKKIISKSQGLHKKGSSSIEKLNSSEYQFSNNNNGIPINKQDLNMKAINTSGIMQVNQLLKECTLLTGSGGNNNNNHQHQQPQTDLIINDHYENLNKCIAKLASPKNAVLSNMATPTHIRAQTHGTASTHGGQASSSLKANNRIYNNLIKASNDENPTAISRNQGGTISGGYGTMGLGNDTVGTGNGTIDIENGVDEDIEENKCKSSKNSINDTEIYTSDHANKVIPTIIMTNNHLGEHDPKQSKPNQYHFNKLNGSNGNNGINGLPGVNRLNRVDGPNGANKANGLGYRIESSGGISLQDSNIKGFLANLSPARESSRKKLNYQDNKRGDSESHNNHYYDYLDISDQIEKDSSTMIFDNVDKDKKKDENDSNKDINVLDL